MALALIQPPVTGIDLVQHTAHPMDFAGVML